MCLYMMFEICFHFVFQLIHYRGHAVLMNIGLVIFFYAFSQPPRHNHIHCFPAFLKGFHNDNNSKPLVRAWQEAKHVIHITS